MELKKNLLKLGRAKAPDLIEWQEVKAFLLLPDRAKERQGASNPVEYDRLLRLAQKIWEEWTVWSMDQGRDAEHPYINGLFVKRLKDPVESILGLERGEK